MSKAKKMTQTKDKIKCIPAHIIAQRKVCFREAASIIKMAHGNGCKAIMISGSSSANTDSILSIIGLRITVGTSVVIDAEGYEEENVNNTIRDIFKLLTTPEE